MKDIHRLRRTRIFASRFPATMLHPLRTSALNFIPKPFRHLVLGTFIANALVSLPAHAADYHIDSRTGDDHHPGTQPTQPWRSIAKVNSITFKPGDRILFAAGSNYTGSLKPLGRGAEKQAIQIDRFGEGPKPSIHAQGQHRAALILENVDHWEIRNLELSNTGKSRKPGRYGILVSNETIPIAQHLVLQNLLVRDVNGAFKKDTSSSAAIFITQKGKTNRRFDQILIADNVIRNCSRNGIVIKGGPLRGPKWNPSTGIIIRKNLIEGVGGDGILPTNCKAPLVEWNTMRNCPRLGKEGGAAAGMWPWACDDALFQFNEVSGHKAWIDAQAYDCDYSCRNTVFQYNLSYDNEGGFMLICSPGIHSKGWLKENALNHGSRIRYNLSLNDGSRTTRGEKHFFSPVFSITGNSTQDTLIQSNLIIIPKKPDPRIDTRLIHFGTWGGKSAVNTRFRSNTFVLLEEQKGSFGFHKTSRKTVIENNTFHGRVSPLTKRPHHTLQNNHFLPSPSTEVTIKGPQLELDTFRKFLAAKGNPQTKHGIKIKWLGKPE